MAGAVLAVALVALLAFLLPRVPVTTYAQIGSPGWWIQLGYNPYHTSFVPKVDAVGSFAPNSIYRAWSFIMSTSDGQMGFHSSPALADVDGDGSVEVVVVDAGGRVVILYGSNPPGLDGNNFTSTYKTVVWVNASMYSSPALADVDGDGVLEVIVGCRDGFIRVVDPASGVIQYEVPLGINIASSPVVADFDPADNTLDIVVAAANVTARIEAKTGRVVWLAGVGRGLQSASSPVLVGDVDGDGVEDVVVANLWGFVYVLSGSDGRTLGDLDLWEHGYQGNFVVHSLAAGDVNGDGRREVVVSLGREVFSGTGLRTGFSGYILVLDPYSNPLRIEAEIQLDSFVWFAQPAIALADVDGDGADEIFVAGVDGVLRRIDYSAGSLSVQWSYTFDSYWPQTDYSSHGASIAVADIDNDSTYEVVLSTTAYSTETYYRLVIINSLDGSLEADTIVVSESLIGGYIPASIAAKAAFPGISLGDLDGDGFLEIVLTGFQTVSALDSG